MKRIVLDTPGAAGSNFVHLDDILAVLDNFLRLSSSRSTSERSPTSTRLYLVDDGFYPLAALKSPYLIFRYLRKLRQRDRYVVAIDLDFLCSRLTLKSNLRLFDFEGEPVSIKFSIGKSDSGNLWNEIEARKTLKSILPDMAICPELLDYDKENGTWLKERNVDTGLFQYGKTKKLLKTRLLEFYSRTLYFDRIAYAADTSKPGNSVVSRLAGRPESAGRCNKMAYAFCHGDLARSNIIRDRNGQVFLCDWENAGNGPVAADLVKLYLRYPDCRSDILKLLGTLSCQSDQCVSAEVQMAIALENFLQQLPAKVNRRYARGYRMIGELLKNR